MGNIIQREQIKRQYDGFCVGVVADATASHLPSYVGRDCLVGLFDGLPEFYACLETHMTKPRGRTHTASTTKGTHGNFYVFDDYQTAWAIFTEKPYTLRDFTENDVQIKDGDSVGNAVVWDVTGDFFDMGLYLTGEPEMWGAGTDGKQVGKRVQITLGINSRSTVSSEVLQQRSKRVLRLIDWLENQGIRARLDVVCSNECGHCEIVVKNFDQPLDINDVAVVSHTDFFRRLQFRFKEHSKTIESGYGSPTQFTSWATCNSNSPFRKDSELINELSILIGSDDVSKDYLDRQFNRLELELVDSLVNRSGQTRFEVLV